MSKHETEVKFGKPLLSHEKNNHSR